MSDPRGAQAPEAAAAKALPSGVATGVGSLPGTDIDEAANIVFGELPEWPHLPELPARGIGADMIGRGAALLVDLPVQWWAFRWEMADLPGIDARRANDFLERDLDALLPTGAAGPVRLTAVGPFTLAANLWRRTGGAMLADPGAVADLTSSLAEGLRRFLAAAQARMPKAALSIQLDEPSLPAALAGRVNTESGLDFYRRVPPEAARDRLREIVDAVGVPTVVHCCAPDVPVKLLGEAGVQALSIDLTLLELDDVPRVDALGEYLDSAVQGEGGRIIAGVVPAIGRPKPGVDKAAADRVHALWHRLGFSPELLPRRVSIATTCGMAGASPDYARFAMETAREAARRLHG